MLNLNNAPSGPAIAVKPLRGLSLCEFWAYANKFTKSEVIGIEPKPQKSHAHSVSVKL
jgi:hypothetical protein